MYNHTNYCTSFGNDLYVWVQKKYYCICDQLFYEELIIETEEVFNVEEYEVLVTQS